jgi:hypothetical protein
MWCNTRTHSPQKKASLNWSLATISPSNHMTHGNSPAVTPGQKRERNNDGQFPLAILNGTRGNTESYHTSQNRENCEMKVMDGNALEIWSKGPQETETLLVSVS